ncbi:hypothetical protein HJFPF1_02012 [Paramyrothecium foliicola]|nr:hypothetical protein HJFPF1_02012 [Paramyrothecium foliicola]
MHVLGHSFSQKRKATKRPRDLHIRKVSFSGSSLSSGGSLSSSSSTSTFTPRHYSPSRTDSAIALDPLSLHPTFHAPARLSERPLIRTESPRWQEAVSFFDYDDTEDEYDSDELPEDDEDDDFAVKPQGLTCRHQPDMALPPHASPLDHTAHDRHEATDYFMFQLTTRPPMPRSRWSESTIQTMDSITPSIASGTPTVDEAVPNFSYKRNTVPKRPTMKAGDSVDNFIKRGGWKRRGIVFHNDEMRDECSEDRTSVLTA